MQCLNFWEDIFYTYVLKLKDKIGKISTESIRKNIRYKYRALLGPLAKT